MSSMEEICLPPAITSKRRLPIYDPKFFGANASFVHRRTKSNQTRIIKVESPCPKILSEEELKPILLFFSEFLQKILPPASFLSDGIFNERGRKCGLWKYFYYDKKLRHEGVYMNGNQEGVWNYFYPTGELCSSVPYKNGRIHGNLKGYYKNGKLAAEISYVSGKMSGNFNTYYKNGKTDIEGKVENDQPTGIFRKYSSTDNRN